MRAGMVGASLAGLERGGCFLEVAKRDIWSPARIAQERPDVAYHLVAVDFQSPDEIHSALRRISLRLKAGEFREIIPLIPLHHLALDRIVPKPKSQKSCHMEMLPPFVWNWWRCVCWLPCHRHPPAYSHMRVMCLHSPSFCGSGS